MKTIKEMIEVMKAYDEGKEIQIYIKNLNIWIDWGKNEIIVPQWNWEDNDYRVKPEPKKRPMTFEEIMEYWKEHRTEIFTVFQEEYLPLKGFITDVDLEAETFTIAGCSFSLDKLHRITKEDGSKFEVEVEE